VKKDIAMKIRSSILAICVLFLAAGWSVSAQAEQQKKTAMSRGGVEIAYSVFGQGEPCLVFVHGWSCDRSVWRKQVPYFEKKFRVITLDLAGHGKSGRERQVYTQKSFGEDIAAVVRQEGADKVILIGHSMSGTAIIEAYFILKEQVAGIIGIDTLQDFEEKYTSQQQKEFVQPFRDDFKKSVENFVGTMFVKDTDPKLVDEILKKMKQQDPRIAISCFEEMLKINFIPIARRVKIPIWCLNADLWPTKAEINRKYVKSFNLRVMPGRGHFLMLESADEFNRQLEDIIAQIKK
jgi:pimeloyl-ACP methyl ester carboxylesterase